MDKDIILVLFYPSNLINYIRIVILVLLSTYIRRKPLLSITLISASSLIDFIDGPIARSYGKASKFGQFLDVSMDRATALILMFCLALFYQNYWFIFCLLSITEILKDFCNLYWSHYQLMQSLELLSINSKIASQNVPGSQNIYVSSSQLKNDHTSHDLNYWHLFQQYVWYSSDLFFIILYCAYFIKSNPKTIIKHDAHRKMRNNSTFCQLFICFAEFINHLMKIFVNIFDFLTKKYNSHGLKIIIQTVGLFLCLGAFLKFYFNAKNLITSLSEIVSYDAKQRLS
jgi:hypothetical protein